NYSLCVCLNQLGKTEEAKECQARVQRIEAERKRLEKLDRESQEDLSNPAPLHEMGVLLLRNGQESRGLRCLEAALLRDRDFKPAHQALADYYERIGKKDLAQEHRDWAK